MERVYLNHFFFFFCFCSFGFLPHSTQVLFMGLSRWREAQEQCYRMFRLVTFSRSRH